MSLTMLEVILAVGLVSISIFAIFIELTLRQSQRLVKVLSVQSNGYRTEALDSQRQLSKLHLHHAEENSLVAKFHFKRLSEIESLIEILETMDKDKDKDKDKDNGCLLP